ncbi:MAG: PilT/PilU family type 4a pilus ATPase [Lentisphaerae bacterium]|nr:PilT/PilU family type 4a pilus ATPase [Lentisphaerota bacterium]
MSPDASLEIQWFAYALADNGLMTDDDATQLWMSLNQTPDLAEFAEAVIDTLAGSMSLEEQDQFVEQIQQLVDYACTQAQISSINSYEDLPGFSDLATVSDEEVRQRMIMLLSGLRRLGCSDLHISAGSPPFVRRLRNVERIDSYVLTAQDAERLNFALLPEDRRTQLREQQDLNLALEIGNDRFRVCLMEQKSGYSGSYRLIADHVSQLEELGFLPKDVVYIKRLLDYHNGLVLVTGPIGSGKSTTLAAMINIINDKRTDHIISVEDPIEIMQLSKNCQVSQREIGKHTASYRTALKAALREDPDIIVIGEMHDLETIENAITASETGHLVIGTLHTGNASNTLNRLLDVFPPSQQPQIRAMTAGSMRGVICQKLVADGFGGLTLIYEIMLNSMAVANIISEGKTFRLESTMVTSNKNGMCTFDQCLLEKFSLGLITRDAALAEMHDPTIIAQLNSLWAQREAKKK